jgi:hypothetical protein
MGGDYHAVFDLNHCLCCILIDAAVTPQSSDAFHVGEAAGSLTTGKKSSSIEI